MQHEKAALPKQATGLDAIIVGTGRCGSTMLSNMFRTHPDVLSLSEFFVMVNSPREAAGVIEASDFWHMLATPNPRITLLLRSDIKIAEFLYPFLPTSRFTPETGVPPLLLVTLPHLTENYEAVFDEVSNVVQHFPPADLAGHYTRLFDWLSQRFGRRVRIERSGHSLVLLPELVKLFPRTKYVHLIRNGRECVWSMSRHPGFRLVASALVGGAASLNREPSALGDVDVARLLAAPLPFAAFGKVWARSLVIGLQVLAQLPEDQVFTVRYEDIITDPSRFLAQISDFIDPALSHQNWIEQAAAMVRQPEQGWRQLPAPDREALERACEPGQHLLDTLLQKGLHSDEVARLLAHLSERDV